MVFISLNRSIMAQYCRAAPTFVALPLTSGWRKSLVVDASKGTQSEQGYALAVSLYRERHDCSVAEVGVAAGGTDTVDVPPLDCVEVGSLDWDDELDDPLRVSRVAQSPIVIATKSIMTIMIPHCQSA